MDKCPNLRLLRGARPGDVQRANSVLLHKGLHLSSRPLWSLGPGHDQERPAQFDGKLGGGLGAAGKPRFGAENDGGIRVTHIPAGSHIIAGASRFPQTITPRDDTVLRPASAWAPTAVPDAVGKGKLKGSPVHAGLAAGNNAEWVHGQDVNNKIAL